MSTKGKDKKQITSKEHTGQGSIFKTAIISAPIAIGGGLGISRLSKQSSHFGKSVSELPFNPAIDAIRDFTNRYVSKEHAGVFKDWQLDKLAGFSKNIALSHEQIKSAWSRAVNLADPTGNLATMSDKRLAFAQTPRQAIADIIQILKSSNSIYMHRAVTSFIDDISVLQNRVLQGLPITPSSYTGSVARISKPVKPSQLSGLLSTDFANLKEALGGATIRIRRISRQGLAGSQLELQMHGGILPDLGTYTHRGREFAKSYRMFIPEEIAGQYGMITHGSSQSKYIVGRYGIVEDGILKQSFKHEEWMMRRFLEDIIPQIQKNRKLTANEVFRMFSEFESRMIEPADWVPTVPVGEHSGIDKYIAARSQIMRLYGPSGTSLNEFQYANLIENGVLKLPSGELMTIFPSHSPAQIAKGIVSTKDVRGVFSLVAEAVPYARRPLQPLRIGYAPTPNALVNMKLNPLNEAFSWAAAPDAIKSPMLKIAYVSNRHDAELAKLGFHSEGQLLISSNLSEQRAVRQIQQFNIARDQLVDLADILPKSKTGHWDFGKEGLNIKSGTFLGYSPDGNPIVVPEDMRMVSATLFENTKDKKDFIRVVVEREIDLMKYSKVFGSAKGMAKEVSPEYLDYIVRNYLSAGDITNGFASSVDAIVTMDELRKNRGLHYNQMFTSLWEQTKINMKQGKTMSTLASNFADAPLDIIAKMRKEALDEAKGMFDHEKMLRQITSLAREARLSPNQMGQVFGAVPDVFGDLSAMGPLSVAEIASIQRGVVSGIGQLFFEGLGGPGAGNTATIEPRMFELLNSPHLGKMGPEIQKEIAERMMAQYPQKVIEQNTLTKSLRSLVERKRSIGFVSASDVLARLTPEDIIPQTATNLRIKGIGDVFIPGSEEIQQLAGYRTASKKNVFSELSLHYRDFIKSAAQYESGEINRTAIEESFNKLQSEVARARFISVTGKGGLLRNRLPGSVSLTAVTGRGTDQNVIGITRKYAEQMFSDLKKLNLYNSDQLSTMRKRFEAREKISGLVGRHPYIGPYSLQAVKFQMIPGEEAIAEFSQKMYEATIDTGRGAVEQLSNPIRLSPMVGMAGDFDSDTVAAMLVSPQLEKALSTHINNPSTLDLYEQYSIRSQVLKAKSAANDAITLRQAMAGDAIKLGITEGGRLGRISLGLQTARAAVLSRQTNLSPQESMNALGLLEWMEQTPISGKHVPPGQEAQMIHLLDDIQEAIARKDANAIAESARAVMAQAKISGQAALREGFSITMEDLDTRSIIQKRIPGIDIGKAASNITDALRAYESSTVGNISAARLRELQMGRALPTAVEAQMLLKPEVLSIGPFGGFLTHTGLPNKFSKVASKINSFVNKLGAAGKSMIPLAKSLALGSATSIGIAAILSDPPPSLGPGRFATVQPNMTSGTGGANIGMQIHPEHGMQSSPQVSPMVEASNTARIAGPGNMQSPHSMKIRGVSPGYVDYNSLTNQLNHAVPGSSVRSSIQDHRISLTSQKVSDILENS